MITPNGTTNGELSRRSFLKRGTLGLTALTLAGLEAGAITFPRGAGATPLRSSALPDIQYDTGAFIAPAIDENGIAFQFGPIYTLFAPAWLTRTPTVRDQAWLNFVLNTVEQVYPFSPSGLFTCVSYGLPYFNRFPQALVRAHIPTLLSDESRLALEEAVPGPTDVSPVNPGVKKALFNVNVAIESHDLLFSFRSDNLRILEEIAALLAGPGSVLGGRQTSVMAGLRGLLKFDQPRLMFVQSGLPRKIADTHSLPYAGEINPQSPMWMGFASQQVGGAGPAPITTFAGNGSCKMTNAAPGDYLDNGSIQHLSHSIHDLAQFYSKPFETYAERCGYMFRSNPVPVVGTTDPYTDGGGTPFCPNQFRGIGDAEANAAGTGTADGKGRIGHLNALQRVSRAADGTPLHIRMDGTGFDTLDVPDGSSQPKLHFSIFVPTADFFVKMRQSAASLDLATKYNVSAFEQGIERFSTATRRQNFLVPPRRHRAFPLVELQ